MYKHSFYKCCRYCIKVVLIFIYLRFTVTGDPYKIITERDRCKGVMDCHAKSVRAEERVRGPEVV